MRIQRVQKILISFRMYNRRAYQRRMNNLRPSRKSLDTT